MTGDHGIALGCVIIIYLERLDDDKITIKDFSMACYQENSIKPYNLEVILTSKAIKVALSVHE